MLRIAFSLSALRQWFRFRLCSRTPSTRIRFRFAQSVFHSSNFSLIAWSAAKIILSSIYARNVGRGSWFVEESALHWIIVSRLDPNLNIFPTIWSIGFTLVCIIRGLSFHLKWSFGLVYSYWYSFLRVCFFFPLSFSWLDSVSQFVIEVVIVANNTGNCAIVCIIANYCSSLYLLDNITHLFFWWLVIGYSSVSVFGFRFSVFGQSVLVYYLQQSVSGNPIWFYLNYIIDYILDYIIDLLYWYCSTGAQLLDIFRFRFWFWGSGLRSAVFGVLHTTTIGFR